MRFDVAEIPGPQAYHFLTSLVAPRPIALVSSLSADGRPNLAPFSFFMAGGGRPPSVAFSPTQDRSKGEKDTLVNVRATGEYVINLVSHPLRESMNLASTPLPHGESEWELGSFTPAASQHVRPTRVAEAPASLECKLFQVVDHGAAHYVIGEVLAFWVRDDLLAGDRVDQSKVDLIARLGGDWYCQVRPEVLFELPRPY